jgi:hypothetical protein
VEGEKSKDVKDTKEDDKFATVEKAGPVENIALSPEGFDDEESGGGSSTEAGEEASASARPFIDSSQRPETGQEALDQPVEEE